MSTDDLAGQRIGRYEIRELLGVGGMGQVYAAYDQQLKRTVALKRLPPDLAEDDKARQRLVTEARSAAQITHQGIAALYDIVEEDGQQFLVMEYVDGQTLRHLDLPLPPDEFLRIATQCVAALAAAHAQGIVHGDIKPDNVMITQSGQLKVLDFGVAGMMALAGAEDATATFTMPTPGSSGATVVYAAPEVLNGKPSDQRADIFSLGLVFHELLSGRHPFAADTPTAVAARILYQPPAALGAMSPAVPDGLQRIVNKMLAKEPGDRYSTTDELLADLGRLDTADSAMGVAPPEPPPSDPGYRGSASHTPASRGEAEPVVVQDPAVQQPATTAWKWLSGAVVLVLALIVLVPVVQRFTGRGQPTGTFSGSAGTAAFDASEWVIAVLATHTGVEQDPDLAAINEGLALTMTTKLAQLSRAHGLQVIPSSTLRERGIESLQSASQELGVSLALSMDTRRIGETIRVNVQLIDVRNERQLFGETVDGDIENLLVLEERVTGRVLRMLRVELLPMEQRLMDAGTEEPRAHAYYLRGQGYLQNYHDEENVDAAVSLFEQALRVDPDYARAHAGLGRALWAKYDVTEEQRWVDSAIEECRMAVELDDLDAEGHICLGTVFNGTGRYAEAADEFGLATSLDPTRDVAIRGLADAYVATGKLDLAEEAYTEAVSLRPHYWATHNWLGIFYLEHGRIEEAIASFEEVVQLAPDSFRGLSNLGAAYYYAERWADAQRAFEAALVINPDDDLATSNLGTLYFFEGRYADAARQFEKAAGLNEEDYFNWGNLADAYYWSAGERQKAPNAYRRALDLAERQLEVNPNDAETLADASKYGAMLGLAEEALEHLEHALELAPGNVDIQHTAAQVYLILGQRERALDLLEAAVTGGYPVDEIRANPLFSELEDNSRFHALVGDEG
jgi:serine/threonine-protein kinase